MLFVSFFWGFLHSSLAPVIELGSVWPPIGIHAIDPFTLPLLGTCLLLASGFVLTLAHHALIQGNKPLAVGSFLITVLLGLSFIVIQFQEY